MKRQISQTQAQIDYSIYKSEIKKKKGSSRGREASFDAPREIVRETYNSNDIQFASTEKSLKILEQIVSGKRFFTM